MGVSPPGWKPVSAATTGLGRLPYNQLTLHSPTLACRVMTSEQAAQLIDNTLDLVHQRLQDLEAQSLPHEHRALAAEFREWRQPAGGHIDLMVFPGLTNT